MPLDNPALDRLLDVTRAMANEGKPLLSRILRSKQVIAAGQRIPAGDCVDPQSGCRWFYHRHRDAPVSRGEHGHFHLFMPATQFAGVTPLFASETASHAKCARAALVHIAALSVDHDGVPMRWFSPAPETTTEIMMPANSILRRLDRFNMTAAPGDPLANAWISSAVQAFAPLIGDMLAERDSRFKPHGQRSLRSRPNRPFDIEQLLTDPKVPG